MYLSATPESSSARKPHFIHMPAKKPGCVQISSSDDDTAQNIHNEDDENIRET